MKYRISSLAIASFVVLVATACYSRRISEGTHLNADLVTPDKRSCGMVVSLGQFGANSASSHATDLRLQAITCGDDGKNLSHLWHAIGASADRQEIFVQKKDATAMTTHAVVQAGSLVELVDKVSGVRIPIGSVELDSYAIPVKLNPGVSAEFRSKGIVVPLADLKSIAPAELEVWFVIEG